MGLPDVLCTLVVCVVLIQVSSSERQGCATTNVNIRAGPGTFFRKVGLLKKDECLPYYRWFWRDGWALVTYNKKFRYISKKYLRTSSTSKETTSPKPDDNCPRIITRDEWGALAPKSTSKMTSVPSNIFIHHGDSKSCTTQTTCEELVHAYQNWHMDDRGWSDIGYSFLIGQDGNIYEGRGWMVVGAHTKGYNSVGYGICFIGDFNDTAPNQAALDAYTNLIKCAISNNHLGSNYVVRGHRDVVSTTCPGDALYNLIRTWSHYASSQTTTTSPAAETSGTCTGIISRADWGARAPKSRSEMTSVPSNIFIHHGDSKSCTTQTTCEELVHAYQNWHMDDRGWSDIGYSFLIGQDGNIYEGRGWMVVGAHTKGYNSVGYGICFIGDFNDTTPNQAALDAYTNLIKCAISNNHLESNYVVRGHRDVVSTTCPGDALYNLIRTWINYASSQTTTTSPAAEPSGTCTGIITRADWGARAPKSRSEMTSVPSNIYIHHATGPSCTTSDVCKTRVRGYQNYHMDDPDREYKDIGYSFLIGQDGNIYEGRGWMVVGSHTKGYNSVGYGVCFIGDFMDSTPNQAALDAYRKLINCGIDQGQLGSNYIVKGHKDVVTSTSCPGDKLYALIKTWSHYKNPTG